MWMFGFITLVLISFLYQPLEACINALCAEHQSTKDFLEESKVKYLDLLQSNQKHHCKIHFVIGNESADLDSIISSIAYAYLLQAEQFSRQEHLYIPLINIHREEIYLRKDILYLFQLFDISADDLLFLDDNVPLNLLLAEDRLRINLVDHNVLRPRLEHLSPIVEGIVDHHFDENKYYPLIGNENKIIAVVGSTATLIAEKVFSNKKITPSPELSTLLLAPILIDTANLQSVEKTTHRDIKAVEALRVLGSETIPSDFYEKLLSTKNDSSNLTPYMILSKDFKEYLDGGLLYGISSLPITLKWKVEDLREIKSEIEKYSGDKALTFHFTFMVNADLKNGKTTTIVYSPSAKLMKAFQNYVQTDDVLSEVFQQSSVTGDDRFLFYELEKIKARKQLQPLFHFSQNKELMTIFNEELQFVEH